MVQTAAEYLGQSVPQQGNALAELPPIDRMRLDALRRVLVAYDLEMDEDVRADDMRQIVMAHANSGKFDTPPKHPMLLKVVNQMPNGDAVYQMSLAQFFAGQKAAEAPAEAEDLGTGQGWEVTWGGPAHKFRVMRNGEVVQKGYGSKQDAENDLPILRSRLGD